MATAFEHRQFGRYFLIEKLATGGMAEIYKAKTYGVDGFEKMAAIKRILPHCAADKDFINMLIDEAKLSVALSHANVVQVYDLGKVGNDYFISMEYINGVNLRDILYRLRDQKRRLPLELGCYIMSEVCKGLDYAHRKTDSNGQLLGIVHRDISPQNILISYEGEVKIGDFGIAKAAMNISHTMAGILKGKIAYMSPEQAMGKAIDWRTDLFSTGIVFFEALTGQKLFTGESQFEVLKKIRTTKIDPTKLPPSLPERLRQILAKALAYLPEDRYHNAGDMQVDLTKHLYGTYPEFSPQHLAGFVKELFTDEIVKQKERGKESSLEVQTASLNIEEEKLQQDIVHRENGRGDSITSEETRPTPLRITQSGGMTRRALRPIWVAMSGIIFIGVLSIFAMRYLPGFPMWEKGPVALPAVFGTITVLSDPPGAKIIFNGKATNLMTPAVLDDLEIGQLHRIRLEKMFYIPEEQEVSLESAEPQTVSAKLHKKAGPLHIISDPSSASIFLDGRATGLITPATIDGLAVGSEYQVTLSKPKYHDFRQTVTLLDTQATKVASVLKLVEEASPSQPVSEPSAALPPAAVPPAAVPPVAMPHPTTTSEPSKPTPAPLAQPPVVKPVAAKPVAAKPVAAKPPVAAAKTPSLPVEAKEAAPATLRLASNPSEAEIYIDGSPMGLTPKTLQVKPGTANVIVKKEGRIRFAQTLTLEAGEQRNLTDITLGELYGQIFINSTPGRAHVFFDGRAIGAKTPVTIKNVRRDKTHTIRLEAEGYKTWEGSFDMQETLEKNFDVVMEGRT